MSGEYMIGVLLQYLRTSFRIAQRRLLSTDVAPSTSTARVDVNAKVRTSLLCRLPISEWTLVYCAIAFTFALSLYYPFEDVCMYKTFFVSNINIERVWRTLNRCALLCSSAAAAEHSAYFLPYSSHSRAAANLGENRRAAVDHVQKDFLAKAGQFAPSYLDRLLQDRPWRVIRSARDDTLVVRYNTYPQNDVYEGWATEESDIEEDLFYHQSLYDQTIGDNSNHNHATFAEEQLRRISALHARCRSYVVVDSCAEGATTTGPLIN